MDIRSRSTGNFDFVRDGKNLSWDEAMASFATMPAVPAPRTGCRANIPKVRTTYPVTGISWYEAAAYAEFAGKSLPTIYHWNRAAGPFSARVHRPCQQHWLNWHRARGQQVRR